MAKVRGVGTTFSANTKKIGGLTSIGGIEASADTVEVTALDSEGGYREYIAGFKDAGEVSLEGFLDDETSANQAEIYKLFQNGTVVDCVIAFPNGGQWTFKGIVTGFGTSASVDDAISFTSTIKVTGAPTFSFSSASNVAEQRVAKEQK